LLLFLSLLGAGGWVGGLGCDGGMEGCEGGVGSGELGGRWGAVVGGGGVRRCCCCCCCWVEVVGGVWDGVGDAGEDVEGCGSRLALMLGLGWEVG
jgi:hypothetical protein